MVKIAPSILSADFTHLGDEIKSVQSADYLHFDVMDGVFVPNISIGIPVLKSVRRATDMTLDVHLMMTEPVRYIDDFIAAGADIVVIHTEADTPEKTAEALGRIRQLGKKAGLSIKPKTPPEDLLPYLDRLDMILVMTVEPGFGGQNFMADMLPKIAFLRRELDMRQLDCELAVDGGVDAVTAPLCIAAGANVLVAGSAVFGAADRASMITKLRG
ncbi:ribulose-phosphate 3-epimerase [Oscillospiraceae bacterium CM]|nr:ribulose-phosphate 3-epimerase [Oscillospiraceae bacterium CM]